MKSYGLSAIPTDGFSVSQKTGALPVTGDVVRVSVLDVYDLDEVLLETANGTLLKGRLDSNAPHLKKGDSLLIRIYDTVNGKLFAKTIKEDNKSLALDPDKAAEVLSKLDIKRNSTSVRVVRELSKFGIELTRENITGMMETHYGYGEEGLKAALFLLFGGMNPDVDLVENMILIQKGVLKLDELLNIMENAAVNKSNDGLPQLAAEYGKAFMDTEKAISNLPEITNIYKDMLKITESIKNLAKRHKAVNTDELSEKINAFEKGLRFLVKISDYIPYLQIPLKLGEKYDTAELFIMKRKKSMKTKATFTVFIRLPTRYMGTIDIIVEFHGRNIHLEMKVDNDNIYDFVNRYKKKLHVLFESMNYKLVDMQCVVGEKKTFIDYIEYIVNRDKKSMGIDLRL